MNHSIPLDKAKEMTTLYRKEKEKILTQDQQGKEILAICERFDGDSIRAVLNQPGCKNLRIYYGMDENLKVHAILVGVDDSDRDMLPETGNDNNILEEGVRCPVVCPPASPLNS